MSLDSNEESLSNFREVDGKDAVMGRERSIVTVSVKFPRFEFIDKYSGCTNGTHKESTKLGSSKDSHEHSESLQSAVQS